MTRIEYDVTNIIDWSLTHSDIIKQYKSKKNLGLITFFHGHIILFQKIQTLQNSDLSTKNESDKTKNNVDFKLDPNDHIIIPSHNIIVTKYLIDLRTDEFEKVSIETFVLYRPECKKLEFTSNRKLMTWKEICAMEQRNYDGVTINKIRNHKDDDVEKIIALQKFEPQIIVPDGLETSKQFTKPHFGNYTAQIYSDNVLFCKHLAKMLPEQAKVLDLGGSNEPWFSYLCAENGLRTYVLDHLKPSEPDIIKKNGATYIQDDINNIEDYTDILSNLDFIFCRHLSPPQRFLNWYDDDFVKIWQIMMKLINETGIIYWAQMTNGTGIPDTFFMNHETKYFKKFFDDLGLSVDITKYDYAALRVMKNPKKFANYWLSKKIFDPTLSQEKLKKDLYSNKDYYSLLKNYALQLQHFYAANDYNIDFEIKITGNPLCSKITQILLQDNFRYRDAKIVGKSEETTIQVVGDAKLPRFTLTNIGYDQNDFFIVDGSTDKRMTRELMTILDNFQLYNLAKKHPKLLDIKKKYFKWIKL